MKAEMIAVGTEILTGQIVNTNAQYISEKLASIGVDVYFQTAVGDNEKRLTQVIDLATKRSDLVLLCGGLGPTPDDLTKETLAAYLGRSLVFDSKALAKLDAFFASRPERARTPNNESQAQIIEGSTPLQNATGLAVGGLIQVEGVTYVVLPGPPSELKPMLDQELLPLLSQGKTLYSRVLRFFGIGESQLVHLLGDLIEKQTDPTLAPYAKTGEVTLRLSTKAASQAEADAKLDGLEHLILERENLRSLHYGYGDDYSLVQALVHDLKKSGQTVTAAESLTAGLFQAELASIPGASQILKGGFVTYSIEAKSSLLQIPLEELKEQGVVSSFTAEKMAAQARLLTQSDLGVSLTGVAGPDSLEGHPAGTVYIGLATENKVWSVKVNIAGRSRQDVRQIACLHAFHLVRQALKSEGNLLQ